MSTSPAELRGQEPSELTKVVSTSEIQRWMTTIETYLNEVCSIANEGKLNSEAKMKVANLCRKIGSGTSQMAVLYQSLNQKALHASDTIEALKGKHNLTEQISGLKETIQESCNGDKFSFAAKVKKGSSNLIHPSSTSSVAIYPYDKLKSSDATKSLVQKIIRPEEIKLQVRGVRKTKDGGVIISTETKQDGEKLKHAVQYSTSGLTADEHHKRKHNIVIVGETFYVGRKIII